MEDKKIFYRGFLANVDDSILLLKLKYGCKIRAIPYREAMQFILDGKHVDVGQALRILGKCSYSYCSNDPKPNPVYIIEKSMDNGKKIDECSFLNDLTKFSNELQEYLHPTFSLIRLFKEGDIRIPFHYCYVVKNEKPKVFMSIEQKTGSGELFHLEDSEINELYTFVENTKLPFKKDFLRLAFEYYESSNYLRSIASSFLNLMISLESLFNPSKHEVTYRISRNAAVLLGTNLEESRVIFSEIKKLYDKRSKFIHTGNSKNINKEDLLKLRHHVRESIKKMYNMNEKKDEILNLLNESGFGTKIV